MCRTRAALRRRLARGSSRRADAPRAQVHVSERRGAQLAECEHACMHVRADARVSGSECGREEERGKVNMGWLKSAPGMANEHRSAGGERLNPRCTLQHACSRTCADAFFLSTSLSFFFLAARWCSMPPSDAGSGEVAAERESPFRRSAKEQNSGFDQRILSGAAKLASWQTPQRCQKT